MLSLLMCWYITSREQKDCSLVEPLQQLALLFSVGNSRMEKAASHACCNLHLIDERFRFTGTICTGAPVGLKLKYFATAMQH